MSLLPKDASPVCSIYVQLLFPEKFTSIEDFCDAVGELWALSWGRAYDPDLDLGTLEYYVPRDNLGVPLEYDTESEKQPKKRGNKRK